MNEIVSGRAEIHGSERRHYERHGAYYRSSIEGPSDRETTISENDYFPSETISQMLSGDSRIALPLRAFRMPIQSGALGILELMSD